jgi:hypothetical protein
VNRRSLSALRHRRAAPRPRCAELSADHPLARAIESVRYTGRQWLHVTAVLIGSAIAHVEGDAWALPMMDAAVSVLLVVTLPLVIHRQRQRDCAIGLILDGRERIPIAVVERQRQRQRLLPDRTRQGLASSLEDIVRQASDPRPLRRRVMPVPCDAVVVLTVASEIVVVISFAAGPVGARARRRPSGAPSRTRALAVVWPRGRCAA